jgi:hypothetical protein
MGAGYAERIDACNWAKSKCREFYLLGARSIIMRSRIASSFALKS